MCGIVGIVESDLSRPIVIDELDRMVRMLVHRGPDEEGHVTLPGVGLGMRRLSIVDLAGGQQPFTNESDSIQLVANGEIYNFPALRQELEGHGHTFRSRSDIEVLVHAYEEWGVDFLRRLRGMFALALWDGRTNTLLAARDRAGEKPLYWTLTPRGLLLASEVKALLVRPDVRRELDLEALDQFLTYEYVIAPRTILKGVHKLGAGHYLLYRDGNVKVQRYWDAAQVPVRVWREDDAIDAIRSALKQAVVGQMMADVPLGAFLSGGIDSSSIVAFMSEASLQPVNSFSIGFDDGSYNELPYAREVAALFGTNHRERTVAPNLEELFDKLVVHLDEPFADVSLFPTYLVSQLAREHVTVGALGRRGRRALWRLRRLPGTADGVVVYRRWRSADSGDGRRGRRLAADGKEEGAGQQIQAFCARRGACPRRSWALTAGWSISGRAQNAGSIARTCSRRCRALTFIDRCAPPWRDLPPTIC